MRQEHARITAHDAEIVVISPDYPSAVRRFWKDEQLPFVGVPDPKHAVASLYEQETKVLALGRLPAMVVIDRTGIVRQVNYGTSILDIAPTATVEGWLRRINSQLGPN